MAQLRPRKQEPVPRARLKVLQKGRTRTNPHRQLVGGRPPYGEDQRVWPQRAWRRERHFFQDTKISGLLNETEKREKPYKYLVNVKNQLYQSQLFIITHGHKYIFLDVSLSDVET